MSDKNKFRQSLTINAQRNKHTPYFDDVGSERHSLWIQEEVNHSRQQQIHRLTYYLKQIYDFFQDTVGPIAVDFYGFGRVKSPYSMEQSIKNSKNLLDALGMTFVVSNTTSETPPEELLKKAIEKIESSSPDSLIAYSKSELEKVLTIAETVGNNILKTDKDDSFDINLFNHNQKFKNAEVLFVHGINQFISRTKKISDSDFPNKSEVFEFLRQAKSATNYGSSIDMYNQFVGFMKQSPYYEIISQRYKPTMKPNRICCISFRCI